MSPSWFGAIQLQLLALVLLIALSALAFAAVARTFFTQARTLPPAQRSWALSAFAAAPLATGAALSMLCALPSLDAALRGSGVDHCLRHQGHGHLCLFHRQQSAGGALAWLALATLAAWLVARALGALVEVARARAQIHALRASARFDPTLDAFVVPGETPTGFAAGLVRVDAFVSLALVERASPALLRALLAHERGHRARRDALRALVTRTLSVAHLPLVRAALHAELSLAAEQACDELAAEQTGDRVAVAESLVVAARCLQPPRRSPLVRGFGASHLRARVVALLAAPSLPKRVRLLPTTLVIAAVGLALAVCAPTLHHAVESVVAPLAR